MFLLMIFTKKATSAQRLRAVLGSLVILGSLKNHKQKKYVMKISWQSDLIYSTTGLAMLNTPVLSLTLKLGKFGHDSTWMGDRLGSPGATGMGSDLNAS